MPEFKTNSEGRAIAVYLSESDLAEWRDTLEAHAHGRRIRDLVVAFAEAEGGETLAFWKAHYGVFWNLPIFATVADAAQSVNLSEDRGRAISQRTWEYVGRKLKSDLDA